MKEKTKRVMQMKTMRDVTTCHIGNAMRWIKGEIVRDEFDKNFGGQAGHLLPHARGVSKVFSIFFPFFLV